MGKLERAKIYVLDGDGSAGKKIEAETIDVCFNPKEYSLEKSVSWKSEKAQVDAPMPEFTEPSAMTLSVTFQFDTYEERVSVRDKYTKKLEKLVLMRDKLGKKATPEQKKKAMPPCIIFCWGRFTFKGVLESLSQKYTMFLSDGTPVRSECAVKIRNILDATFNDGNYSANPASTNEESYTCVEGDRLDSVAAAKLNDVGRWPEIAALSDINDPLQVKAGTVLKIPK